MYCPFIVRNHTFIGRCPIFSTTLTPPSRGVVRYTDAVPHIMSPQCMVSDAVDDKQTPSVFFLVGKPIHRGTPSCIRTLSLVLCPPSVWFRTLSTKNRRRPFFFASGTQHIEGRRPVYGRCPSFAFLSPPLSPRTTKTICHFLALQRPRLGN